MNENQSEKKLSPDEMRAVMSESGMWLLTSEDTAYPELLRRIADPPKALYVRGELPKGNCVAIVGSRRDTRYGRQQAFAIGLPLSITRALVMFSMFALCRSLGGDSSSGESLFSD